MALLNVGYDPKGGSDQALPGQVWYTDASWQEHEPFETNAIVD